MAVEDKNDTLSDFELDADLSLLGGDFEKDTGSDESIPKVADIESDSTQTQGQPESDGKGGDADIQDSGQKRHEDHDERSTVIPRARFDEVNQRLKSEREAREALEARLQELENGSTSTIQPNNDQEVDIVELERLWQAAILDDEEKAVELRSQINAELRRQVKEETLREFEAKENERVKRNEAEAAQKLLNETAEEVIKAYPALDLNSANGDESKFSEVLEWRNYLIVSKGQPAHEALREAAKRVLGEPGQQQSPMNSLDKRTEKAVQRGLKESQQQPPTGEDGFGVRAAGFGMRTPETQDDYERMPSKERERLLQ